MSQTREIARDAGFEMEGDVESTALARTSGAQLMAREQAEIQAACIMALKNPRSEADCFAKIVQACKRPSFAEGVRYVFPRGGASVEGPSVKFAREAARCWGNIRYGYRVTDATDERTTVEGWALDLETNTHVSAAITFKNLVQRKRQGKTEWVAPDERDLRELVSKNGAIGVRNALLQIIPPDIVDEALRFARETLEKAARGEITQDRAATIRRLVTAFRDYGVSGEMIETKLGHPLDLLTAEELADLRGVFASIKDGQSKREEHFELNKVRLEPEGQGGTKLEQLGDKLKAAKESLAKAQAEDAASAQEPRTETPAEPAKVAETTPPAQPAPASAGTKKPGQPNLANF